MNLGGIELDLMHLIALLLGIIIGVMGTVFFRPAKEPASARSHVEADKPSSIPKKNVVVKETFTAYISRVDVERGMTIPLAHHLSDVVVESQESGKVEHQLKLVFIGYDKGPRPEENHALLKHLTLVHEQSPHLAIWLDDESLETYLKLLHLGMQLNAEPGKIVTWTAVVEDIAARAPAAIRKDLGAEISDATVSQLLSEGMDHIRAMVELRLDVLHEGMPGEGAPEKLGTEKRRA